ncbi:hypothetical protein EMCRGX_G002910 [Ephydatia muelleri]|eukprot:Em0001g2662a
MVATKKKSKRLSSRQKFKVERKIREHHRKVRKETRKKGHQTTLKKDPGIPNLYPFKEHLMKQLEEKKQRAEEDKERRKLERQKEHARKRSLQGLQNDAERRTKEFDKKQELVSEMAKVGDGTGRTDGSLRAYYKEFKKVVESSDVILEVLDARDPLGSRCFEVEQTVLASGTNKKLVLVLNKIDLVPRPIVELWLKHLRNEFPTVAFKASTQSQKNNLSQKKLPLSTSTSTLANSSVCLGADVLVKLLANYCRNSGIKTCITVGVVGLPNVGKSSIINSLKRSKACTVGATPGVTKTTQEVQLDKHVKLLDSPGVVMAKGQGDSMVLRNCIKLESLADTISPVEAILRRCNKAEVMEHYCIPEYSSTAEFLSHLAKKMGKLRKGGIPDTEAVAKAVIRDWNTGRIKFYTHPPDQQSLPTHISAEIVKEWGAAFDLKALEDEEKNDLLGLSDKMADAMVVESSGPVTGVLAGEEEEEAEVDSEDMESLSDELDDDEEDLSEMEGSDKEREQVTVHLPKKDVHGKSQHQKTKGRSRTHQSDPLNPLGQTGADPQAMQHDAYDFGEYF